MNALKANIGEISEVLSKVSLVKLKCGFNDVWVVSPILYFMEDKITVLYEMDENTILRKNDKVVLKFNKKDFEYFVYGEIDEIDFISTITIKIIDSCKYRNKRKYSRFETDNIKVYAKFGLTQPIRGIVRDLSLGGAMVVFPYDFNEGTLLNLELKFDVGVICKVIGKIIRKINMGDSNLGYGIQFIDFQEDSLRIFNDEFAKIEKDYLKHIKKLRSYFKNDDKLELNKKVTILSDDFYDSIELRENLIKIGIENFEIFHKMQFYYDYFIEENPNIVIFDFSSINEELIDKVKALIEEFPDKNYLLIVPFENAELLEGYEFLNRVRVLYKPILKEELKQELMNCM